MYAGDVKPNDPIVTEKDRRKMEAILHIFPSNCTSQNSQNGEPWQGDYVDEYLT